MATITVPMSSAAQRGADWEKASGRAAPSGISFDHSSLYSKTDAGTRTSSASSMSGNLNSQQFKPASMSENMHSYYSTGSFPKATTDAMRHRAGVAAGNQLKSSMNKSHNAGMSNMWANTPRQSGVNSAGLSLMLAPSKAKSNTPVAKVSSGGASKTQSGTSQAANKPAGKKPGKQKSTAGKIKSLISGSKHAGSLAQHLRNVTGAK